MKLHEILESLKEYPYQLRMMAYHNKKREYMLRIKLYPNSGLFKNKPLIDEAIEKFFPQVDEAMEVKFVSKPEFCYIVARLPDQKRNPLSCYIINFSRKPFTDEE